MHPYYTTDLAYAVILHNKIIGFGGTRLAISIRFEQPSSSADKTNSITPDRATALRASAQREQMLNIACTLPLKMV